MFCFCTAYSHSRLYAPLAIKVRLCVPLIVTGKLYVALIAEYSSSAITMKVEPCVPHNSPSPELNLAFVCRSQNVNQLHFLLGPTHQQGGGEEGGEEGDGGAEEGQEEGGHHQPGDSRVLGESNGMSQRLHRRRS